MQQSTPIRVSVIIPALNEERWIGECLTSLRRQTHPDYELIVVDDGSRDRTAEIALDHGARLVRTRHAGAGGARHEGAGQATGEVLVFLDADEIFEPEFLEHLVAPLRDPGVRATFPGGVRYRNPDQGLAPGWLWRRGIRDGRPPRFQTPHRIAKAVRRADFDRVGGYPREGYGEDRTFSSRIGPAVVVDEARWEFTLPTAAWEILKKAIWIGRGPVFAREYPPPWRIALGSIPAAVRLLGRGMWREATVRLIYDAGLLLGALQGRFRPSVRHRA